jgi:hypothetical protein
MDIMIPSFLAGAVMIIAVVGIMFYSIALQKKATDRQARGLKSVDESLTRQKEALELQKENNELLKEILKTLKNKS